MKSLHLEDLQFQIKINDGSAQTENETAKEKQSYIYEHR